MIALAFAALAVLVAVLVAFQPAPPARENRFREPGGRPYQSIKKQRG
jgi:hypothetical protein